ncbi:MAG TPA: response regulator [Thermoanaerobaculia bacterium]|nr:response regulator [Thermoanaerobaculia bacterium]
MRQQESSGGGAQPSVLLIEDNEQNRYLVTFLLERHGFEVISADTGPRGLALAEDGQPDLILLDIQLPGMDGYEVARHLRALPHLAVVPIVAVTSYAMVGDRERTLAAGCNGYIEKPIRAETFVDEIRAYLPVGKAKPPPDAVPPA